MDKDARFRPIKILSSFLTGALALLAVTGSHAAVPRVTQTSGWKRSLSRRLREIDRLHPGQVGIYVKDLSTGEDLSFGADQTWYLASGVKVPIAIEVLRQLDAGKLTLDEKITLGADDYVDGAGSTNRHRAGSKLSVRYLLGQMLVHSDNTASDLLIKRVGLDHVNELVREHAGEGFARITTLGDVRRNVYGGMHPSGFNLRGKELLQLKSVHDDQARARTLASMLHVKPDELGNANFATAYESFYRKGMNSSNLRAYSKLLEEAVSGKILSPASTALLVNTMAGAATGTHRLKAGFPRSFVFAHKTGTQRARVCDFGVAWDGSPQGGKRVLIAACTQGFESVEAAEEALAQVGHALHSSGVFTKSGLTSRSDKGVSL